MRTVKTTWMAAAIAGLLAGGCAPPPVQDILIGEAVSGDLEAVVTVDRRTAHLGQTIGVTLTVRNTSRDPIPVESRTAAPMIVTVWNYDSEKRWRRVKEYPQVSIFQRTLWVLSGKEERTFAMKVPVEPDWPARQLVKLTAELNGRTDARPYVLVEIRRKQ